MISTVLRYYEGGVSSVYMWKDDDDCLVACFVIKKGFHWNRNSYFRREREDNGI